MEINQTTAAAPKRNTHSNTKLITTESYSGPLGLYARSAVDYSTNQIEDPFKGLYAGGGANVIITPPYPPEQLIKLPQIHNMLGSCISAMVTNCDGFKHTLEYIGVKGEDLKPEVVAERERIEELLNQPCGDQTFTNIRKWRRADYETVGWATLEVGTDSNGVVQWFKHIPSHTCRKTFLDSEPTEVSVKLKRGGKIITTVIRKRFRRYVQMVGGKKVYFKERDDPRPIDWNTGNVLPAGYDPKNLATALIWKDQYAVGDAYGIPRWAANMPSVLGSRQAEMVNYTFFEDNAIPAMCILVSGGMLTEGSVQDIRKAFSQKGAGSHHRVLILEAKADTDNLGSVDTKPATPIMSMQPLAKDRQDDALFTKYIEQCSMNVRSSFRLPPIFLGLSDDYTHATATASLEVAKSQVFLPEQHEFDLMMNGEILADRDGQPPKFWRFKSNPPKLMDNTAQVNAFKEAAKAGGISINTAIHIANEWLGLTQPSIRETWADWPVAMVQSEINRGTLAVPGLVAIDGSKTPKEEDDDEPKTEPAPTKPKRFAGKKP